MTGRATVAFVTGRWPYASGSVSARAECAAPATSQKEMGTPPLTTAGIQAVRLVYVPADRVKIHDETWDVTNSGLVGTGSHDFSIDGVFVPLASGMLVKDAAGTASPACDPPVGISLARSDHAAFSATLNFDREDAHEAPAAAFCLAPTAPAAHSHHIRRIGR